MEPITRHLVQHAQQLAQDVGAKAVVLYADAIQKDDTLLQILQAVALPAILATRSREVPVPTQLRRHTWITVPRLPMTRAGQVKAALLVCLVRGVLHRGDRVICLTGIDGSGTIDSVMVLNLRTELELLSLFDSSAFAGEVTAEVFERVLHLAAVIAAEGQQGWPVGTLFVLGDSGAVLAQSRRLVLNPFQGHPENKRDIHEPALEQTIKKFAALDGAFVVRGDGVMLCAGTHLVPVFTPGRTAPAPLPGGLGTRHAAAAAITATTSALAICVSQSTGNLTVFKSGQMITEIHRATKGNRLAI